MSQFVIVSHAALVGLTPLIPVPILDDVVKSFFYRTLVQSLASAHDLSLSADEINALAEERGRGCLNGCLFGLIEYLVKRLVRKVIFVLEWRRAIDLATHTYYVGHLLDYAFQKGWYTPGDVSRAARLRAAIERARGGANINLVKRVVQSSFDQSRKAVFATVQQVTDSVKDITLRRSRVWLRRTIAVRMRQRAPRLARWLYVRLRPTEIESAQVAQVESAVAQSLERETPRFNAALSDLLTRLQENLAALPREHFDVLQDRLENLLAPGGP
jgi:hypothetical protein